MNAFHRWAHFNDPRFDYRNPRDEFVDSDNVPDTWGSRITYDRNSDLTLKVTNRYQKTETEKIYLQVTDTEVIWSMEGFKDEGPARKKWTEFKFALNISEKEWFPLFVVGGCSDYNRSVVEIVHSNIG